MLTIKNLYKSYDKFTVLKGITLEIKKGEVVVVIGPSGSGKSTLLRCINFLESPDNGLLRLDNVRVNLPCYDQKKIYSLRRKTGMVFQNYNLFKNKTALQNVIESLLVVKRLPYDKAILKGKELLDKVGLLDKKDCYPSSLSGGQQQRIGIARALAIKPELMLFDEPTSALDPELVGDVLKVIKNLTMEDMTMLIVTHEMAFASQVADRILFLDKGQIIEEGTPEQIFNNPVKTRTRKFLSKIIEVC